MSQNEIIDRVRELRGEFKKYLARGSIKDAGPDGTIILGLAALMENIGARDPFGDVVDFHRKFNINYEGEPRQLPLGLRTFRKLRLEEEHRELTEAYEQNDHEKMFDGLLDMIYIALGTIHLYGWDFHEGWRRVHEANMSKVRTSDKHPSRYGTSMVHDDGKPADIVKPKGWKSPTFADLVAHPSEEEIANMKKDPR